MAGKHTRGEFARDFAKRVGAEADTRTHVHTMVALQAWMQAEHGINDESPEARFNPLNTTLEFPGSTLFNELSPGFGVRNYATYDDGLTATARTLNRAADRGPSRSETAPLASELQTVSRPSSPARRRSSSRSIAAWTSRASRSCAPRRGSPGCICEC